MAVYRAANKERTAEYIAAYRAANKKRTAEYSAAYRAANKKRTAEYSAAYAKTPAGRESLRRGSDKYNKTQAGREAQRRSGAKQRIKSPFRFKAVAAVNSAVKAGKLPRASTLTCICGQPAKHYHHNSYKQEHWLDVTALCIRCHNAWHRILTPEPYAEAA